MASEPPGWPSYERGVLWENPPLEEVHMKLGVELADKIWILIHIQTTYTQMINLKEHSRDPGRRKLPKTAQWPFLPETRHKPSKHRIRFSGDMAELR